MPYHSHKPNSVYPILTGLQVEGVIKKTGDGNFQQQTAAKPSVSRKSPLSSFPMIGKDAIITFVANHSPFTIKELTAMFTTQGPQP